MKIQSSSTHPHAIGRLGEVFGPQNSAGVLWEKGIAFYDTLWAHVGVTSDEQRQRLGARFVTEIPEDVSDNILNKIHHNSISTRHT